MITKDELVKQAEELAVHPSNVQRDYVFGWVLAGLYSHSDLGNNLILKGGNCFRKVYFEKARYSPDLDFATTRLANPESLKSQLTSVCEFIHQSTGVKFDTSRTRVEEKANADTDRKTQKARLYFRDFFGEESEVALAVRLDISQFGRAILPVRTRQLIHQYLDNNQLGTVNVKCLQLEELLAAKLKCLLQRRHSADFYDIANATLLAPTITIDSSLLVKTFLKMTIFSSGPGVVKDLLINLPFPTIRNLWEKYVTCPRNAIIEFDRAVNSFTSFIGDLFGGLPRGTGQFAFFPANFHNPIMEAGHELTVLRIVYDGIPREIEPYSLVYKVRRDGVAREYLYAYDQTGGQTSGPGLKSLVHPKISAIENTDIKFDPKYEVELSKAGEFFGDRTFRGNTRLKFGASRFDTKYTVQCPICGKQFQRKKYDAKLYPHLDKFGNKFPGRVGYIV